VVPFVEAVMDECRLCRQQRLRDKGLGVNDQSESYFLLDSPIIRKTEDHYGPVRFMHAKHAVVTKDCALCHHYRPLDEAATETTRCSACHQEPFQKDHPERLGLKAAYHQQCMGCHQEMNKGPIDCAGCHRKNVPDHKDLIQLAANPEPSQVTANVCAATSLPARTCSSRPTGCGKGLLPTPLNTERRSSWVKPPLPRTTSESASSATRLVAQVVTPAMDGKTQPLILTI
jgi:hypothetical protein